MSILVLALITKDDHKHIGDILKWYINNGVCNICIVDLGSTDNTIQIINDIFSSHNVNGKLIINNFINFTIAYNHLLTACVSLFPDSKFILQLHDSYDVLMGINILVEFCHNNIEETNKYYHIRKLNYNNAWYNNLAALYRFCDNMNHYVGRQFPYIEDFGSTSQVSQDICFCNMEDLGG